jgi:phosphomannomutase
MSLIKSISGIRGTIGGAVGDGLTPLDIVKFTSAYATFIRKTTTKTSNVIVVGRDARISGEMVNDIVEGTLVGCGFDVVNIGMASTPTTEIAVVEEDACGGIIITASHNPKQWNALKLLNENGEFLNDAQGKEVLRLAQNDEYKYACIDKIGKVYTNTTYARHHINKILDLDLVDVKAIKNANCSLIKGTEVVDLYRDENGKSITVRIYFAHPEKTLTREEVMNVVNGIIDELSAQGIELKK